MKITLLDIGAIILLLGILIAFITLYYYPSEKARHITLDIIDEALREATEDTPDYIEPDRSRLYFRNSISLQTLRDAIKSAEMRTIPDGSFPDGPAYRDYPFIFVGEQRIGDSFAFLSEYPKGRWWRVIMEDRVFDELLSIYTHQITESGEGFGMSLETGYPIEAARSYMLAIIDEALLEATEDTPDYIEPDRSKLYFRNSISLQTLRDGVKDAYRVNFTNFYKKRTQIGGRINAPNTLGPIYLVGEEEIGDGHTIWWEYEGIWWRVEFRHGPLGYYASWIGETGEGFGMYQDMDLGIRHYTVDKNMREILPEIHYMSMGEDVTLHAFLDGSESLVVGAHNYCSENITVQRPDGSISLYVEDPYIDIADYPLVIPVDEAGTWSVTVASMASSPPSNCTMHLLARPAAVKLDLPEVTDDPYLLSRIIAEMPGTVVVTENEEPISLSQPLADGKHRLDFQRVLADGRESIVTRYFLTVDSHATEAHAG